MTASITIRNLNDAVKERLRIRAAEHDRSVEEEIRDILRQAVGGSRIVHNLATSIYFLYFIKKPRHLGQGNAVQAVLSIFIDIGPLG